MIRTAQVDDADSICGIYNPYVRGSIITFEEGDVSRDEMAGRIGEAQAASLPWLVAEQQGRVVGYAYASKWKGRCAYRYSVESTVYLAPDAVRKGVGTALYRTLFDELRQRRIHAVLAGIALPNPASVALHEKVGMRQVAQFREVGFKFDKWIDVGYWECTL